VGTSVVVNHQARLVELRAARDYPGIQSPSTWRKTPDLSKRTPRAPSRVGGSVEERRQTAAWSPRTPFGANVRVADGSPGTPVDTWPRIAIASKRWSAKLQICICLAGFDKWLPAAIIFVQETTSISEFSVLIKTR